VNLGFPGVIDGSSCKRKTKKWKYFTLICVGGWQLSKMQETDCKNPWYSELNTRRHQLTLFLVFSLLLSKLLLIFSINFNITWSVFFGKWFNLLWAATGFLNHHKGFTLLLYAIHIVENQQTRGLSLLVLYSAPRGFLWVLQFSLSLKNRHLTWFVLIVTLSLQCPQLVLQH